MKIVMTMVVRDEEDVLDANLRFHLNAGVEFVIATDHRSRDGTADILRSYERAGVLRVVNEPGEEYRASEWRTRAARLAATEHGADWVISADADEFWWPRGRSLDDVLARVPGRYGIVQGVIRNFVPVAGDEPFPERMVYRLTPQAPINDPTSPWRPYRKMAHRGSPRIRISAGTHTVSDPTLRLLRGWYPIEVLHFPMRSPSQLERKGAARAAAAQKFFGATYVPEGPGAAYHAVAYAAASEGTADELFASLGIDAAAVDDAVARGVLEPDVRLRDVLRALEDPPARVSLPTPTVADDALFAVDVASLGDADVMRARRTLDELDARLQALESLLPVRAERRLRSLVRRLRARRA